MGEARFDLSRAVENSITEGVIVLLTAGAESTSDSVPPGTMGSKVAGTCAHLVDMTTYEPWEASKGVRSKTTIVHVCCWYNGAHIEPVGEE